MQVDIFKGFGMWFTYMINSKGVFYSTKQKQIEQRDSISAPIPAHLAVENPYKGERTK